jgi:hypothetical protein
MDFSGPVKLGLTLYLIQWIPGFLSPAVKPQGHEAGHSPTQHQLYVFCSSRHTNSLLLLFTVLTNTCLHFTPFLLTVKNLYKIKHRNLLIKYSIKIKYCQWIFIKKTPMAKMSP